MPTNRKKYIVGNWKMHMGVSDASLFVHRLEKEKISFSDVEVVIAPTYLALQPLSQQINRKQMKLAAQNVYHADEGAYTGEVSAAMLKEFVDFAIIGHSERRRIFGEHDDDIARKMSASIRYGITPILCIGEDLIERQDGHSSVVVHDQLLAALAMLTADDVEQVIVAYEPLWAIGSGVAAKPATAKEIITIIRRTLAEIYGKTVASKVPVLYGGSTNADNISAFMKEAGADGALVGGTSLNYKAFATMIEKAHKV